MHIVLFIYEPYLKGEKRALHTALCISTVRKYYDRRLNMLVSGLSLVKTFFFYFHLKKNEQTLVRARIGSQ